MLGRKRERERDRGTHKERKRMRERDRGTEIENKLPRSGPADEWKREREREREREKYAKFGPGNVFSAVLSLLGTNLQ